MITVFETQKRERQTIVLCDLDESRVIDHIAAQIIGRDGKSKLCGNVAEAAGTLCCDGCPCTVTGAPTVCDTAACTQSAIEVRLGKVLIPIGLQ